MHFVNGDGRIVPLLLCPLLQPLARLRNRLEPVRWVPALELSQRLKPSPPIQNSKYADTLRVRKVPPGRAMSRPFSFVG